MKPSALHTRHIKFPQLSADRKLLAGIMLLSFAVNFIYIFTFSTILLGNKAYIGGDTSGWTDSFLNLLHHGTYTFNLANEHAAFGRVPGFSFFWGIHYLVFGETYVYQAVAVTQGLLNVLGTYLIFSIAVKIYQHNKVALLAALIYAVYPFTLYWVTVSYAEPLSNFITLLWANLLLNSNKSRLSYFILGILAALAFYTREFMGSILIVAILYILFDQTIILFLQRIKYSLIVFTGFILLYSMWPIRNYVFHNRILLGRDYNGFNLYNDHLLSYTDWVLCWDSSEGKWIEAAVLQDSLSFPPGIFKDKEEELKAKSLIQEANRCATSFIYWKQVLTGRHSVLPECRCDEKIKTGFDELRFSFMKQHTWRYLFDVPSKNLYKVFFKNQLQEGSMIRKSNSWIYTLVFGYRSLLLLLAVGGIVMSFRIYKLSPIIWLSSFIIFFMCFLYRYIEMRNFMQIDSLLIVPGSYFIILLFNKAAKLV